MYSISFAHSFTFYEHGFCSEHQYERVDINSDNEYNHTHNHLHSKIVNNNNSHISHDNHCDESIVDLIACVLSDFTNHNHEDCEIEDQSNDDSNRLSNKNDGKQLPCFSEVPKNSIDYKFKNRPSFFQLHIDFKGPIIENNPLRGPPIFC